MTQINVDEKDHYQFKLLAAKQGKQLKQLFHDIIEEKIKSEKATESKGV